MHAFILDLTAVQNGSTRFEVGDKLCKFGSCQMVGVPALAENPKDDKRALFRAAEAKPL